MITRRRFIVSSTVGVAVGGLASAANAAQVSGSSPDTVVGPFEQGSIVEHRGSVADVRTAAGVVTLDVRDVGSDKSWLPGDHVAILTDRATNSRAIYPFVVPLHGAHHFESEGVVVVDGRKAIVRSGAIRKKIEEATVVIHAVMNDDGTLSVFGAK